MDAITVPTDFIQIFLRLALATALGAAIGVNRELGRKPAGLRTHSLVSLGAAVSMIAALHMGPPGVPFDGSAISRIIQGLVTGVGFIGAGVILHRDDARVVHGLTTAASIWVVAAVGIAAGLGLWRLGVAAVVLLLLVFAIGGPLDRRLRRWREVSPRPADDD